MTVKSEPLKASAKQTGVSGCVGNRRRRPSTQAGGKETFCRIESSTGCGEVEAVVSVDMIRWGRKWNGLAGLIRSIGRTDRRIDMNPQTPWLGKK